MRTGRSDRSIGIATRRTARIMASSPSITNLGRAPHRLMFFVGGLNLLLAMAWWAAWLISARWGLLSMPQPEPYAGRLHAFLMQYQVLPSFFFGFLLTVFPRRSDEHTSEIQSLMRISYAVFCLKKKKI